MVHKNKIFFKKTVDRLHFVLYSIQCSLERVETKMQVCASGSVVEYRLAKARVAGSNPVSRSSIKNPGIWILFLYHTKSCCSEIFSKIYEKYIVNCGNMC